MQYFIICFRILIGISVDCSSPFFSFLMRVEDKIAIDVFFFLQHQLTHFSVYILQKANSFQTH